MRPAGLAFPERTPSDSGPFDTREEVEAVEEARGADDELGEHPAVNIRSARPPTAGDPATSRAHTRRPFLMTAYRSVRIRRSG